MKSDEKYERKENRYGMEIREKRKFYLLRDEGILMEEATGVSGCRLRRRGGRREEEEAGGVAAIPSPKCEVKGAIASLGKHSRHRSLARSQQRQIQNTEEEEEENLLPEQTKNPEKKPRGK